jgi:NitT/TauT family transport system substrate-binding protein
MNFALLRWFGLLRWKLAAVVCVAALGGSVLVGCGPAGGGGGGTGGEEGDPVTLTIGYQPYWAGGFSGVIMRDKEFWKKHLPEGSKVNWQVGLQGSIIVSQMLAGKQQMGYLGDMPALVAVTKRPTRDLRIVATTGFSRLMCNVFLTRRSAPDFATAKEAIQWMDGKRVATPHGACSDRFARTVFEEQNIQPSSYLNQSIEVVATNFEQDKVDAATLWEPNAARLVNSGVAKQVATGENFGVRDAGFLAMSKELMEKRPDIVQGWLRAELEAQQFFADPKNAMEVARMATRQVTGFEPKDMWDAAFQDYPVEKGGPRDDVRMRMPFVVDEEVDRMIDRSVTFLHEIKTIRDPKLPEGAIDDSVATTVLKNAGLTDAGTLKELPESEFGP